MCPNGHDPIFRKMRPDGRVICEKCASKYHRRTRRFPVQSSDQEPRNVSARNQKSA